MLVTKYCILSHLSYLHSFWVNRSEPCSLTPQESVVARAAVPPPCEHDQNFQDRVDLLERNKSMIILHDASWPG